MKERLRSVMAIVKNSKSNLKKNAENGKGIFFKRKWLRNFPNWWKICIHKESVNPKRIEKNIDRSKYIILKLHNIKDKGTMLKIAREKDRPPAKKQTDSRLCNCGLKETRRPNGITAFQGREKICFVNLKFIPNKTAFLFFFFKLLFNNIVWTKNQVHIIL